MLIKELNQKKQWRRKYSCQSWDLAPKAIPMDLGEKKPNLNSAELGQVRQQASQYLLD